MSVANEVNMADTLLPCVPRSSSSRTETGTTAISGSAGSASQARQVVAQGAGADGQHDVVDLDVERLLDRLDVVEREPGERDGAMG